MKLQKRPICEGVNLSIIETDKFKTNYIAINFITPLAENTASLSTLLPAVLKRGCVKYPDIASLQRRYDMLYSTNVWAGSSKLGEAQIVKIGANMLDNRYVTDGTDILGGTIELIGDILFNPLLENGAFRPDYVSQEKANQIDAVKSIINNKGAYANVRCIEEMCRGELYSVASASVEMTEAITPESLYSHYLTLIKTAPVEIYFVGNCDFDALERKLAEIFAPHSHTPAPIPKTNVIRRADSVREFIEEQPVAQGKLSIGFRTGKVLDDGDYHIFATFCELFGGSPAAKLFMNVREKLSLCYYCQAIPHAQKGIMVVASGIEVAKKELAQSEILAQLDDICQGKITDEEFSAAKKSLINGYKSIGDNADTIATWYMNRAYASLDTSPEETAEKVMAVTVDDVIECAKNITLDTVYFMKGTLLDKNESEEG